MIHLLKNLFHRDENDAKLKASYDAQMVKQTERLAEAGDAEAQLTHLHNTGDFIPARDRMNTIGRGSDKPHALAVWDLARQYDFFLKTSDDESTACLHDLRWSQKLAKNTYGLGPAEAIWFGDLEDVKAKFKHARNIIERRAVAAGLKPKGKPRNRNKAAQAA